MAPQSDLFIMNENMGLLSKISVAKAVLETRRYMKRSLFFSSLPHTVVGLPEWCDSCGLRACPPPALQENTPPFLCRSPWCQLTAAVHAAPGRRLGAGSLKPAGPEEAWQGLPRALEVVQELEALTSAPGLERRAGLYPSSASQTEGWRATGSVPTLEPSMGTLGRNSPHLSRWYSALV